MAPVPQFTLYSRNYCHLCQDMLEALLAMRDAARPFGVAVIDIDAAPAGAGLLALYDELVPVLFGALDEPSLCHYFLDKSAVEAYLAR